MTDIGRIHPGEHPPLQHSEIQYHFPCHCDKWMDLARTHRWSLTNKTGAKVFKNIEGGSLARSLAAFISWLGRPAISGFYISGFWFPHFWFLVSGFCFLPCLFLFFTVGKIWGMKSKSWWMRDKMSQSQTYITIWRILLLLHEIALFFVCCVHCLS